jgi:hypothetical protein
LESRLRTGSFVKGNAQTQLAFASAFDLNPAVINGKPFSGTFSGIRGECFGFTCSMCVNAIQIQGRIKVLFRMQAFVYVSMILFYQLIAGVFGLANGFPLIAES